MSDPSRDATDPVERRQQFRVDEAIAAVHDFKGEIRSLKVVVLVGGVLLASAVIGVFGVVATIRSGQDDARDRGYRNRTVACVQTVALIGAEHMPDDCVELTKIVDPTTGHPYFRPEDVPATSATLTQQKTRALLCGFFREIGPDAGAFIERFETETGERCEDPPKLR